jgi:hypothetical protein
MGRWARLREKKEESGPASKKRRKEMGCMGKKEMRVGLLERFTVRNGFEVFKFFFYFH